MADQPTHVDATFYAIIEPQWRSGYGYYGLDSKGRAILEGAKVNRITQKKPTGKVTAGGVVTKLTLRVDANVLLPLQPEAVIEINAGNTELIEVTVEAPELNGDDE